MAKAGFDPAAAAPSQPDRLDGSRSDHSAGSGLGLDGFNFKNGSNSYTKWVLSERVL